MLGLSGALLIHAPNGLATGLRNTNKVSAPPAADSFCRGTIRRYTSMRSLVAYLIPGAPDLGAPLAWRDNWNALVYGPVTASSSVFQNHADEVRVQASQTIDISVGPNGQDTFSPNPIAINVGDTVRWTFASAGHNVVSGPFSSSSCVADNNFCSPGAGNCADAPSLNPGSVYSHTFTTAGTFPYFCSPHCFDGMTGTIIVQAAATPTPTPTPSPTATPKTVQVAVGVQGAKSFAPNTVIINVGDSVRWTFLSDGHNVVSGSPCTADDQFCSPGDANCSFAPNAFPGQTYTHVFNSPGTFNYFCQPHCIDGMTGTIIVQGNAASSPTPTPTPTATPTPGPNQIQLSATSYSAGEADQQVLVTINRSGDTSGPATVNYATSDSAGSQACNIINGSASSRCDYISALGTLNFAAGETSKTVSILIIDDAYQEGAEVFNFNLSNVNGASFGTSSATVTINDNDSTNGANPIDQPGFFVTEHYYDFLNRLPDSGGLAFWTNEITSCGSDQTCIGLKRINVSAAYFLSIEFQQTGYLVERMYKAAYGSANGASTLGGAHQIPVPVVRFNEFLPDTQEIGQGVVVNVGNWQQQLENNKQAFALEFVQRPRFATALPTTLTPDQFTNQLFANAGVTPSSTDLAAAVGEFGSASNTIDVAARARALRDVAENSTLSTQEFNRAFVLMQFFGYLRRNPNDPQDTDYTGYEFWLTKLNQFNGDFVAAEMVKAFITSAEYRQRFGT